MKNSVRVERIVRRHFGGRDDAAKGEVEVLRHMELRDKRLDLILTFDIGGNTTMFAETLARRTSDLCCRTIGTYSVRFFRESGEKRLVRIISYDGNPETVLAGKRIFLLGDVLEQGSLILRLAKEIANFAKRMIAEGHPELAPTIVGIGAPVIRDFGMKEYVRDLLGYLPELHYLVHARQYPRQQATQSPSPIFSLQEIRQQRRPPTKNPGPSS